MNPLIEKFWNDAGYKILIKDKSHSVSYHSNKLYERLWVSEKDGSFVGIVGTSDIIMSLKDIKCLFYYFEDEEYSEEDMLKIVKMSAFI